MPIVAASIVAGTGIVSSIMGSSAAKKQAKAEAENRRRAALANYQMTMQKADVEEQMQIQGIFAKGQAAIAQEKMNNKIAMANYKYAAHREQLAVMQKNFNASRGRGGGSIPAGLTDELADQQMQIIMEQEKANDTTNKQFTKALDSFSNNTNKRKLSPYSSSVMRYKMIAYNDLDKQIFNTDISSIHKLRAAERAMRRRIKASGGGGGPMSKFIPGRKPTLYDSSKTITASTNAEIANVKTMAELIRSNAEIAKKAETQNIATGYEAARNAAGSQMMMGIAGSIAGGVGAYINAGENFTDPNISNPASNPTPPVGPPAQSPLAGGSSNPYEPYLPENLLN
jgi:hypothetical protein